MVQLSLTNRAEAITWFTQLQASLCAAFEAIEANNLSPSTALHAIPAGQFVKREWPYNNGAGGGTSAMMRGRIFEKVGVNLSAIEGEFSPAFRESIPGTEESPAFWAAGVSLVAHFHSPHIPPAHMNTRCISTQGNTWCGGAADLNPIYPIEKDTKDFHAALKAMCDPFDPSYYPRFKEECDRYFFLPHRNEHRGVGGIFYDYLNDGWDKTFAFTQAVGRCFESIITTLINRHVHEPWSHEEKNHQRMRRGRYAEFNLLYDRGTKFGLMTGGNTESILMSLPPEVTWA